MNELIDSTGNANLIGETWSVMVLYEDKPTRDRAMALCDRLVKNFWTEVEFDFRWWRTDFLNDPRMARTAAAEATDADIVIFNSIPEAALSPMLLDWFESWSGGRQARGGMFLDLTEAAAPASALVQRKQARLRKLAAQANLEYFNRIPPPLSAAFLNSWRRVEARANHVPSALDDILNRLPPPTHFGLNE